MYSDRTSAAVSNSATLNLLARRRVRAHPLQPRRGTLPRARYHRQHSANYAAAAGDLEILGALLHFFVCANRAINSRKLTVLCFDNGQERVLKLPNNDNIADLHRATIVIMPCLLESVAVNKANKKITLSI